MIAYDFTKRNDTINCDGTGFNKIKSSSPLTIQRFKLNKFPEKKNMYTVSDKKDMIKNIITSSLVNTPKELT